MTGGLFHQCALLSAFGVQQAVSGPLLGSHSDKV